MASLDPSPSPSPSRPEPESPAGPAASRADGQPRAVETGPGRPVGPPETPAGFRPCEGCGAPWRCGAYGRCELADASPGLFGAAPSPGPLDVAYRRAVVSHALATALASHPLAPGVASDLVTLWAPDAVVTDGGDQYAVTGPDGSPLAEWVADRVASLPPDRLALPPEPGPADLAEAYRVGGVASVKALVESSPLASRGKWGLVALVLDAILGPDAPPAEPSPAPGPSADVGAMPPITGGAPDDGDHDRPVPGLAEMNSLARRLSEAAREASEEGGRSGEARAESCDGMSEVLRTLVDPHAESPAFDALKRLAASQARAMLTVLDSMPPISGGGPDDDESPEAPADPSRRLVRVYLDTATADALVSYEPERPATLAKLGLPPDTVCVGYRWDHERDCESVILRSEAFPPVALGDLVPVLTMPRVAPPSPRSTVYAPALLALALLLPPGAVPIKAPTPGDFASTRYRAELGSVYDGDTCTLRVCREVKVRLAGVDAPELASNVHGKADPVPARASRDHLAGLLSGRPVYVEEVGRSFDRAVARLWVERDGRLASVGEAMVSAGMARAYP